MNSLQSNTSPDWDQIRPVLDAALDRLSVSDRDALVLRFFEQRSLAEVGQRLGLSEDAARKRVGRALDRLRTRLARQGAHVTLAGLATCVSANALQMAPQDMPAALTTTALSGATGKGATLLTILNIMTMTKLKIGLISAILIVSITTPLIVHNRGGLKQVTSGVVSRSHDQPSHAPDYFRRLHQMAGDQERNMKELLLAFHTYASEHNDQFPTNLQAAASYLTDEKVSQTDRNQIEIFYQGPLAELGSNTEQGKFILFRDKRTWPGPDGKPTRVYGMGDGSVQTIESDDQVISESSKQPAPIFRMPRNSFTYSRRGLVHSECELPSRLR